MTRLMKATMNIPVTVPYASCWKYGSRRISLNENGEGDFVMDMKSLERRENMLQLREQLITVEDNRLSGIKGFSPDEVDRMMKRAIEEILDGAED